MTDMVLVGIGILVALIAVAGALVHRRRTRAGTVAVVPARSLVRMLRSEDELRDAVWRAASFEQMVAATMQARTRRYEAMMQPAPITDITAGRAPGPPSRRDDASRSA